jgi:hypothetical protein
MVAFAQSNPYLISIVLLGKLCYYRAVCDRLIVGWVQYRLEWGKHKVRRPPHRQLPVSSHANGWAMSGEFVLG